MIEPVVYTPVAVQTVTYTATAGTSTALGAQTSVVRLVATTDCWVKLNGYDETTDAVVDATNANSIFLPALVVEYFIVRASQKISVVRNAASGSLYVAEMSR